ncbi:glycosyltransferase [Clostridium estertheticum]|uniref:Glycosyltransferase n=1 Tax=Clostridium estertheticum TaxID=238834 RepID=A0A7Y3SXQ2_9CLOT|nr:glycosyltransferase [Clostridium estertheticum]NNU77315.1 glycosyltransferase [Clostridium estertheticum]WBL47051.1 glycosyltransferase [Clostridium estertheticum]
MKKVLIMMNNLAGGGAEKVLINLMDNFDYKNYTVDLFLLRKEGVYLENVNSNVTILNLFDIKIINNNLFGILRKIYIALVVRFFIIFPEVFYKLNIKKNYDVEIAYMEGQVTAILSGSLNKKSRKVAWVHTDLMKYKTFTLRKQKKIYKNYDSIVCVSEESKQSFLKLFEDYSIKVTSIPNIIDIDEINKLANEKTNHIFKNNTIIVVGRLIESKRFDLIINAHRLLLDENINNELIIVGDGYKKNQLMELAKELKVDKSVLFKGFLKNPYPYMKNADIVVLCSDYEGLPTVLCEAIVMNKAIVTTNFTGVDSLLNFGQFGMVIEKNNYIALKDGLKRIFTNRKLKEDYELKCDQRKSIFDTKNVMKQVYDLIDK